MPTWNAESDAALFRAVVSWSPPLSHLSQEQRDGIVAHMRQSGFPNCTWEAVRYVVPHVVEMSKAQAADFPWLCFLLLVTFLPIQLSTQESSIELSYSPAHQLSPNLPPSTLGMIPPSTVMWHWISMSADLLSWLKSRRSRRRPMRVVAGTSPQVACSMLPWDFLPQPHSVLFSHFSPPSSSLHSETSTQAFHYLQTSHT